MPSGENRVILGIHSQVGADTEGSSARLTDGHSWISVTRNGGTEYYGLWPDEHPRFRSMPPQGTDIRVGIEGEPGFNPTASRYYELTPQQVTELDSRLGEDVSWSYTNTCASWASETTTAVTSQRIDASELLGFTDTPRELINAIRALEKQRPTTLENPVTPSEIPVRSSSFGSLDRTLPDGYHPASGMYQQALTAIEAEHSRLGQTANPEQDHLLATNVTRMAMEADFGRISRVVLPGDLNGKMLVMGSHVDPGERVAFSMNEAQKPAIESFARIDELSRQAQVSQASEQALNRAAPGVPSLG
ncbi:MAG: hypothetical protein Q4G62_08590 [Pseudomonadota bacterium]|nr:hypothetical protein [Pseudomonadota bacterium]